jgi:hypothetical protein
LAFRQRFTSGRKAHQDFEARDQLGGADAFLNEIGGADGSCALALDLLVLASDDDDRQFANPLDLGTADTIQQFEAIDLRHGQVADDHADRRVEQYGLPGGLAVGDFANVEAVADVLNDRRPHDAGVVGNQDARPGGAAACDSGRFGGQANLWTELRAGF